MGQALGAKSLLCTLIVLLIMICVQAQEAPSPSPSAAGKFSIFHRPKTVVDIFNNFSNASEIVVIQCRSRMWIVEAKAVRVNQSYAFKFRPNFVPTLYYYQCKFIFETGLVVKRDVYNPWRDSFGKARCKRYCLWVARDDALYGYRENGLQDIIMDWPKEGHHLGLKS